MPHTRKRTIGTPPDRCMSVVGILFPVFLFGRFHTYVLSDSPEIGRGEMTNGSSSTSTSPTPTGFSTINSNSLISTQSSPSSLPAGASSPSGGSGSNMVAIVGGVLGAIIVLAIIAALGIYFYLRRKRRNVASPASSVNAALSPDGPAVVLDSSLQVHTEAGGNVVMSYNGVVTSPWLPEAPKTSMADYVRVFVPSSRSSLSFTALFRLHSQNSRDPITFLVPQRAPCTPEVFAEATFDPYKETRDAAINRQASWPSPLFDPRPSSRHGASTIVFLVRALLVSHSSRGHTHQDNRRL